MKNEEKMGICWAAAMLCFQAIAALNFWLHQPVLGTVILVASWGKCSYELFCTGEDMGAGETIEEVRRIVESVGAGASESAEGDREDGR